MSQKCEERVQMDYKKDDPVHYRGRYCRVMHVSTECATIEFPDSECIRVPVNEICLAETWEERLRRIERGRYDADDVEFLCLYIRRLTSVDDDNIS